MLRLASTFLLLAGFALSGCTNPLLGEWDLIEKAGESYPLVEEGEAAVCTTTTTADLNIRQHSDNTITGDYYERSTVVCAEQKVEDKISWDVEVDTVKRDEWILDLRDDVAEDATLDCHLDALQILCEDDNGEDWIFEMPEEDE